MDTLVHDHPRCKRTDVKCEAAAVLAEARELFAVLGARAYAKLRVTSRSGLAAVYVANGTGPAERTGTSGPQ